MQLNDGCFTDVNLFGLKPIKFQGINFECGTVLLNKERGVTIDIILALELEDNYKVGNISFVTFLDQRKRIAETTISINKINNLTTAMTNHIPQFIKNQSHIITSLHTVFTKIKPEINQQLPNNSFIISFLQSNNYYGSTLSFHPATSPRIDINTLGASELKLLSSKIVAKVSKGIINQRKIKNFETIREFEDFLNNNYNITIPSANLDVISLR